MQRLGKNISGYRGDVIDVDELLADLERTAQHTEWVASYLNPTPQSSILTLSRGPANARARIYLSTGIHGDEPAGPLAVQQLVRENIWPPDVAFWICPCLNAPGFRLNRRESEEGVDLNRDYQHLTSSTVRAHVAWLAGLPPFDFALCLHEDWEANGFYLYELNPDEKPSLARAIVDSVASVCPLDLSPVIEGREAHGGIIRTKIDLDARPRWPEAFYLVMNKTRLSYTLEAPSDYPLPTRVASLVQAVRAVLARV
jgi:predicted deacylase